MHLIFLVVRIYPYWALALAIILLQLALFFRRKAKFGLQNVSLAGAGLLVFGIIAWFVLRGDLNSDRWVRMVIGG